MILRAKTFSKIATKGLLVLGVLLTLTGSGVAHASSNEGPIHVDNDGTPLIRESNTYGNSFPGVGRYWDYVVSNDNYTDIWSSDVLVYSPVQKPTITIIGSDLCVNNSQGMRAGDVPYSPAMPSGRRANDYRLYTYDPATGNGVSVAYNAGFWNYGTAAACRATTVTLTPAGYSPIDPGTGMYIYRINALANLATGGKFANSYHVVGPAGSIITQSAVPSLSGFGMQASYPVPDAPAPNDPTPPDPFRVYTDLDIPFGPDCSLTTPTAVKHFAITDADNVGQYSVQPQPFNVSILAFTQSTGVYRGPIRITPAGNVNGGAIDISGNGTVWQPIGSNQTGAGFDFTVQQGVVYRLRISRVYFNNTLQFRLPYDGAHYYIPCMQPRHIRAVTTMTPNPVENGQTITGTTTIVNSSANTTNSPVDFTRRVWADRNRNGVYDAGDTTLLGPQSGSTFVPPSPGDRPVVPDWTATADSATMGGRVCIALGISAAAPVVVDAPAISISCADIGKKPKIQVMGGDVTVGGTFRNGAGVCPVQSPAPKGLIGSLTTVGGTIASSFTQYGAFSLGQLTLFGANNAVPGYPFADSLSFGNTTNFGYFYSAGRGTPATGNPLQARCLDDPFAVYSSKANVNSASTSVDLATAGANLNLTASGTIQIGTGSPAKLIPAGKRIIVYAPNATTVEIRNDIAYADGPYGSIDQLPQVVVLTNGNIVVDAGVKRIDGIYAAKGDFTTCEVQPRLNTCTNALEVNGLIVAGGNVKPFRTAGVTAADYLERAEVIRLRPDVLLNQITGPSSSGTIRTIDQREVPPRF